MAPRPRFTNQAAQRLRAPRERALRKKIHDPAISLERKFEDFLVSRDLLEDMAREAAQRDAQPETNGKGSAGSTGVRIERSGMNHTSVGGMWMNPGHPVALAVHGIKRAEPIPEDVLRLVEIALARAEPLWGAFELEIAAGLLSEAVRSFETGAQGVIRNVGLSGSFDLRNPRVLDALAVRANQLAGDVADTTFEAIKETIARKFFVEGRGPAEVAKALQNEFDFLSAARSSNIARTETGVITEMGAFEQYSEIGVERKMWLSALVEQTRPGHRKAHGQTVGLFDPFIVEDTDGTPEEMLHPLDPDASPGNVVNCLCSSGPVIEGSLDGPWLGE